MRRIEDHCVCCDLPCINCGRRNVEVIYCDDCEDSDCEKMFNYNGRELCYDCAKKAIFNDYIYGEKLEGQIAVINQIIDSFIVQIGDNKYVIGYDFSYEYSLKDAIIEAMDYISRDIDLEDIIDRLEIDCTLINLN